MKTIKIGVTNRIYLNTVESVDAVKISITDYAGNYVKLSNNIEINDLDCLLDETNGRFYYDVMVSEDTKSDYYYIFWTAYYSGLNVALEDEYSPEDLLIEKRVEIDNLLVSPSYILDHYLRGIDISIIQATYQKSYRDAIRDEIKAATEQLEKIAEIYFQKHLIEDERHDYDMTPIYEKYWTNTLYHSPVISVVKARLKLNKIDVIKEIPPDWVQIGNAMEGVIKVMPYSGGYNGLMFVYTVGIGIAVLLAGSSYIPDFFSYDYYAGLDWDNIDSNEKTDIRNAIGRRVALNMLPNLDVHRGLSSESKSVDGVSKSVSYTSSAIYGEHSAAIEAYQKQEAAWIQNFKKKYLTRLKVG